MVNVNITIKVAPTGEKYPVEVDTDITVEEFKETVEATTGIDKRSVRLIFKGHVLRDPRTLESFSVVEGACILAVKGRDNSAAPAATPAAASNPASSSTAPAAAPSPAASQPSASQPAPDAAAANPFAAMFGGMGAPPAQQQPQAQANPMMGMGANPMMGMDPNAMAGLMNNPAILQMASQMMSNPEVMRQMMQMNPMMRQLQESNPMMAQMMQDDAFLQQMARPENLQAAFQMQQAMASMNQGMGAQGANPAAANPFAMFGAFPPPAAPAASPAAAPSAAPAADSSAAAPAADSSFEAAAPAASDSAPAAAPAADANAQPAAANANANAAPAANPFAAMFGMPPAPASGAAPDASGAAAANPLAGLMQAMQAMQNAQAQNPNAAAAPPMFPFFPPANAAANPYGAAAPAAAPQDPAVQFATQISSLEGMGFVGRDRIIAALQATGGNIDAAIDRLLQG